MEMQGRLPVTWQLVDFRVGLLAWTGLDDRVNEDRVIFVILEPCPYRGRCRPKPVSGRG